MKINNGLTSVLSILFTLLCLSQPGLCNESEIPFILDPSQSTQLTPKSPSAVIRKGPYLIYPGVNTEMSVLWQLDSTEACTIEWGQDTSYSDGSTISNEYGADHQHKVTITSLLPGTKYYYRVWISGTDYTGSFMSAPSDSAENITFFAYGDTRTNPDDHDSVCQGILNTYTADPAYQSMLLHSGDWVASGDLETEWDGQYFNRSWSNALGVQANLPIQGCMGNHEQTGALFIKYWPYPFLSDRYWSFDYGPAHFVVIDQYIDYGTGSPQLTWIEADLASSTKEWKFLVFHEPGWSAGGHNNNVDVQTYLQPLCETYGVDMVIAGHNHYYARCLVNGVQHITAGGGGGPLYAPDLGYPFVEEAAALLHYCKVTITGDILELEALTPAGSLIDSVTIDHSATTVDNWILGK